MSINETPFIQPYGDFYCFAVFDSLTQNLIYSKYNFNFLLYQTDKNIEAPETELIDNNVTPSYSYLFYRFLVENETDLWQPFTVKDELKKYFLPITTETQKYFDLYNYLLWGFNNFYVETHIDKETILKNQFNLILYDYFSEIPIVCMFFYDDDGSIYSKFNFNFDDYSFDFNVYGCKLSIFNDFLLRISFLSDNPVGYSGFNKIPDKFKKYFYTDFFYQYDLKNNFSPYKFTIENIDWSGYLEKLVFFYGIENINTTEDVKIYFITTGQFEEKYISLINYNHSDKNINIEKAAASVCTVIKNNCSGTGFLIQGPPDFNSFYRKNIYLVTSYDFINDDTNNVVLAICNYYKKILKLMFRIIGFDKYSNICICIYDETLEYNRTSYNQYIDLLLFNLLELSEMNISKGQKVCIFGNQELVNNSSYIEGYIMDNDYSGNFGKNFVLSHPSNMLINIDCSSGISGAPLFIKDNNNNVQCVGMLNSRADYNGDNYCIAIKSNIIKAIVYNSIKIWFSFIIKNDINNIEGLRYYNQDIYSKKWLGVIFSYYDASSRYATYQELNNLSYVGGLLITKFILGFNTNTKEFITDYDELSTQNVIKIDTPLLKSVMYSQYISNRNVPILLKTIKLYDGVNGEYKIVNLGKYEGQESMNCITYNFTHNGAVNNSENYTNLVYFKYNTITFEYYSYNGKEWILYEETIGGNTPEWYNIYDVFSDKKVFQHKWEYPLFLIPYLKPFSNGNEL